MLLLLLLLLLTLLLTLFAHNEARCGFALRVVRRAAVTLQYLSMLFGLSAVSSSDPTATASGPACRAAGLIGL